MSEDDLSMSQLSTVILERYGLETCQGAFQAQIHSSLCSQYLIVTFTK